MSAPINNFCDNWDSGDTDGARDSLREMGCEVSPKCCALKGLQIITSIALVIVGSLAVAGVLSPAAAGFTAVGLGAAYMTLELGRGEFSARKFDLISAVLFSATVITVGALGGAGVFTAAQVGWGALGAWMCSIPVGCCLTGGKIANLARTQLSDND